MVTVPGGPPVVLRRTAWWGPPPGPAAITAILGTPFPLLLAPGTWPAADTRPRPSSGMWMEMGSLTEGGATTPSLLGMT